MEINKVQWRMIAKGAKLPCDSFLMRKDGTIPSVISSAGVEIGQDAYYLPVEELRSFPKEESEDERIRKELIAEVKEKIDCIPVPDCRDKEDEKALKQLNKWLAWLEKQAEKKPDDKVEPKFKVGDWVVVNDGRIGRIIECTKDFADIDLEFSCLSTSPNNIRSWTIQDAKDGDVLATEPIEGYHSPFVAIYKKQNEEDFDSYCFIGFDDKFYKGENGHSTEKIHPATKEQRDTLLKAMSDAGYTFDFDKKELKKIEQNTTWSEEDEYHKRQILRILKDNGCSRTLQEKTEKWIEERLKSLRPQNKCVFLENVWHTPDETPETGKYVALLYKNETLCTYTYDSTLKYSWCSVVKWAYVDDLVRPQTTWKPSDEQMEALKYSTYCPNEQMSKVLFELYQDLKNL